VFKGRFHCTILYTQSTANIPSGGGYIPLYLGMYLSAEHPSHSHLHSFPETTETVSYPQYVYDETQPQVNLGFSLMHARTRVAFGGLTRARAHTHDTTHTRAHTHTTRTQTRTHRHTTHTHAHTRHTTHTRVDTHTLHAHTHPRTGTLHHTQTHRPPPPHAHIPKSTRARRSHIPAPPQGAANPASRSDVGFGG